MRRMMPGETSIADVGALDLSERAEESLYVEAFKSKEGHAAGDARGSLA